MKKMKVLSLFSGIGAFEKALTNIGVDYEIVGFSEIDKWAIESYSAIHDVSVDKNLGDVSEITEEDLPNANMVTYGFPCQDVSVAGQGAGIAEGTRSGLLYEAERIIEHIKPKYAIAENVKNLIGKRHKEDFDKLLERLEGYGYNNYWEVLNSRDFGIPQNRERVFIVSIRKDVDNGAFKFPKGSSSGARLKDILLGDEDEVDDKYYIENEEVERLLDELKNREKIKPDKSVVVRSIGRNPNNPSDRTTGSPTEQRLEINRGGTANTLTTVQKDNWVLEPSRQKRLGGLYDKNGQRKQAGSLWDKNHLSPTISTMRGGNTEPLITECKHRIRKLTPQECWRLMGFEDEDYWTARRRLEEEFYNGGDRSNSQMYKQAGNSIVVDVLEGIFEDLLKR